MQFYQGDLLFEQVPGVPAGAMMVGIGRSHVLAEGEATGHAHTIDDCDLHELNGVLYVNLTTGPRQVKHQEHDPITLTPGTWRVGRQREWSSEHAARQVVD